MVVLFTKKSDQLIKHTDQKEFFKKSSWNDSYYSKLLVKRILVKSRSADIKPCMCVSLALDFVDL